MRNLFDEPRVRETKERIARLRPESERQWGRMNPAQAMAHCSGGMEWALGDRRPPRVLIGRVLGPLVKSQVFRDDKPIFRNAPTGKDLIITDDRDLQKETARLVGLIDRFTAGGPAGCTTHPHPFFGPMTAQQWSILMYKHLDHHLRQFGV